MREPLVAPLAALAAGILIARLVWFDTRDLAWALPAVLLLALLALRHSSRLAATCCLVGFVMAGILIAVVNRPGRAPELDAESGEVVTLAGCVVEASVFSDDRE